jgi:hypothetical protein
MQVVAIVALVILLTLLYPFSAIQFWSKLASTVTNTSVVSYLFLVNFESVVFCYVPLFAYLSVYVEEPAFRVVNLGFIFLALVSLYFHPIVSLNHHRISQVTSALLLSTFIVSALYGFLGYF